MDFASAEAQPHPGADGDDRPLCRDTSFDESVGHIAAGLTVHPSEAVSRGKGMEQSRLVAVNDVELFVRELGQPQTPEPPLFVIHGGPDWDHSYLLPGLRPVAAHRRVVMFDMRGCGRSTGGLGREGYQPEFVVADLAALIAASESDLVDLLGFSTGGQVAQLFVEEHPHLVRRLILASTTAYPDVAPYLAGWAEAQDRERMRPSWPSWAPPQPAVPEGHDLTLAWAINAAPGCIWDLSRLDAYLSLLSKVRFTSEWLAPFQSGRLHPWRPKDPEAALTTFAKPVLVLHGEQDMAFPVQVAHRLVSAVPDAALMVIGEAGHMAHFEHPREWAKAVVDFLG